MKNNKIDSLTLFFQAILTALFLAYFAFHSAKADFFPRLQREYIIQLENIYPSLDQTPLFKAPYLINQLPSVRSFDRVNASTFKAALQLSMIHCSNVFERESNGLIPLLFLKNFSESDRLQLSEIFRDYNQILSKPSLLKTFENSLQEIATFALNRLLLEEEISLIEMTIYLSSQNEDFLPSEFSDKPLSASLLPFVESCVLLLSSPEVLFIESGATP